MKIMITHIPNIFNYGSAMMAMNLMYYLNKESKDQIEFYTDARTMEDFQNLINWTGIENIKVNNILPDKSKYNTRNLNLDINWVNEYCEGIINYYDYFIVLGGDDLSEYYSKEILVNELYKIDKISGKIPAMLIGQTIGPFTEWRTAYAADKLKKCSIYTRDLITYDYLKKKLHLQNVIQSADLAFMNLPMQNQYNIANLLDGYGLNKDEYITLIPSGQVKLYTENVESYINNWEEIICYLIEKYNCKIVLLPHVLRPKEVDDRVIIEEIIKRSNSDRLIYVGEDLSPLKARLILGNGRFVVTGRMHGAVSSFQMGKPAISLSYSVKYYGVIGKGLNCSDLIVECDDDKKWNTHKVKDEVIDRINYLSENYTNLVTKISYNSKICEGRSNKMIKDICKVISGGIYEENC